MRSRIYILGFRIAGSILRFSGMLSAPFLVGEQSLSNLLLILFTISIFPTYGSLEYYTYSNRSYLENINPESWSVYIYSTITVVTTGILLVSPIAIAFLHISGQTVTIHLSISLVGVIAAECILNELTRTLVILEQQPLSSCLYFLRQLSLFWPFAIFYFTDHIYNPSIWLVGHFSTSILLIATCLTWLWIKYPVSGTNFTRILVHIRKGKGVIFKYLVSGHLGKLAAHSDRIIVGVFASDLTVATYLYVQNIVNGISSFIEPLINQLILPSVLKKGRHSERAKSLIAKGTKNVIWFSFLSITLLFVLFSLPLDQLSILSSVNLGGVIVLATLLQFGLYGKFILYITSKDTKHLLTSAIFLVSLVFFFTILILSNLNTTNYLVYGLAASHLVSLIFTLRFIKNDS